MYRSSDSVQVATAAPLLRLVLVLVLMVAVLAGVLVAAGTHIGWITLAFALVAGPVAAVVDGRSRTRTAPVAIPRRSEAPARQAELASWRPQPNW
ncbi:MAG TPA: hypothetical protein VLT82_07110 [Myxococcaceae bacterium]|nr:hypothetical protein [Myxococcaceae bacterium]